MVKTVKCVLPDTNLIALVAGLILSIYTKMDKVFPASPLTIYCKIYQLILLRQFLIIDNIVSCDSLPSMKILAAFLETTNLLPAAADTADWV